MGHKSVHVCARTKNKAKCDQDQKENETSGRTMPLGSAAYMRINTQ